MTKIKICGLSRAEDILTVNRLRPDFAGFVFAKSRRQVSIAQAEVLSGLLIPDIKAVGVFVNEDPALIEALCAEHIIDVVQLHGDEDRAYMEALKKRIDRPVIRAVRVRSKEQVLEAQTLPCEYLLLDTYTKDVYGGSGERFDLSLIPELTKPFFLAGGLTRENVTAVIQKAKPYGVDVSSSLETDGYKDKEKMTAFMQAARTGGNQ